MAPRVGTITVNTEDLDKAVAFWSSFLGVEVLHSNTDIGIVWLCPDTPDGVNMAFQLVATRPAPPNEVHLDIAVDDLDSAQAKIEQLGGSLVAVNHLGNGFEWRVVTDSEGNQFCILCE
ncbi:MAG: VOC family protein [Actinomycetia bacterium]|nr:VOC family protein [Actinomycetes bacterium]MCP4958331.1 VOC family protein [Actinomycetes bacterium]